MEKCWGKWEKLEKLHFFSLENVGENGKRCTFLSGSLSGSGVSTGPGVCRAPGAPGAAASEWKIPFGGAGLWLNRFLSPGPSQLCQCKNSSLGHLFGSHGREYKNGPYLHRAS